MKAGPKFTYDVKKFDDIIASIFRAQGSLGQVADLNEIPRRTFYDWLSHGDEDNEKGFCTELGQLSRKIRHAQAEVVIDLCKTAFSDEKKSKFIMWWLSKICREDFGIEGIEIKELRDLFKIILPLIGRESHGTQKTQEGREEAEAEEVQC
ncbi:MAG: hypothetical protein ACHQ1D_02940 [Nitrososphaerales archaeon]